MTESEAIDLLKHHSYGHDDIDNLRTERGFLGMLRPFNGHLIESNFHEVMAILDTLKDNLRTDKIDREIISSFWAISHFTRAWALTDGGMLKRNRLLNEQQEMLLSKWVDCISYTIAGLLDKMDDAHAFEEYRLYLEGPDSDKK